MTIDRSDPGSVDMVVDVLVAGGVAILPCDTVYGLVGVAPATRSRIAAIKGRDADKPILVMVADPTWLDDLGLSHPSPALERYWPGPLTIILPTTGRLPEAHIETPTDTDGTAVRVPDDPFLQRILERVRQPLYSTSVNRAGEAPLSSPEEIDGIFGTAVDLIVSDGELSGAVSTIVDARVTPPLIVRQGALRVPEAVELRGR